MHVGEHQKAQLLSHVHRVHGKVVFELGNGDKSIQLEQENRETSIMII